MSGERLVDKCFANTSAVLIGVNEKRFQMPFMQKHEAERPIKTINRKTQGHLWKKA